MNLTANLEGLNASSMPRESVAASVIACYIELVTINKTLLIAKIINEALRNNQILAKRSVITTGKSL